MSGRPTKESAGRDIAVRERLLQAALQLFNSKGYAATSVREIVAEAGVTKPVLYYYFTNKEGIYLELMSGTFATFQGVVTQLVDARGPARDRIIAFALGILDGFGKHIEVVRLMYAIFFGPPQGAPFFRHEQFHDTMIAVLAGIVAEGVRAGEFRSVLASDVTWALFSCMHMVMEEQLCRQPPRVDRAGLERMLALVLDGISVREQ